MSFLENAGGFTPVPDKLKQKYDFSTAYIWGIVWRYCQMEKGYCDASHEAIAERAGMSRRTLIEKLNTLIQDGFIDDLTPDVRNRPHQLCTKKGEVKIEGMQISHTDSDIGMRNLHSDSAENAHQNDVGMQILHTTYAENAHPGMQNLHLKKQSLRESFSSTATRDGAATKLEQFFLVNNNKKTALAADEINAILNTYPPDDILYAISEAVKNNAYTLSYVDSICKRRLSGQPDQKRRPTNGTYQRHSSEPKFQSGEHLDNEPTFDPYTGKEIPAGGA